MLSLTTDKSEIISALRKVCVRVVHPPPPLRVRCPASAPGVTPRRVTPRRGTACPCRRPDLPREVGDVLARVSWVFTRSEFTDRAGVCSSINRSEPSSGSWGSSHRIGLVFSKESNLPQVHLLTQQVWGPHAAPTWAAGTGVLRGCVPRAPHVPVCLAQCCKGPGIRVPLHPTGGGTDSLQPQSSFPSGAQKHAQS